MQTTKNLLSLRPTKITLNYFVLKMKQLNTKVPLHISPVIMSPKDSTYT